MKKNVKRMMNKLRTLNRDQQGADMIEYILVIAAIALPLLGLVVWFGGDIKQWVLDLFSRIRGSAEETMPD